MKILHITTGYNHGGAAIACKRLVETQRSLGIDAEVITQEKVSNNTPYIFSTTHTYLKEKKNFIYHAIEKFVFLFYEKSSSYRFQFSIANTGENISNHPEIHKADIIHFHWFNAGFISLKEFEKILKIGKPVVWTLHDMWAFTGGCHYAGECTNFKNNCGNCYYLSRPGNNDLSNQIWVKKNKIYSSGNLTFITPSNWLSGCVKDSGMLKDFPVKVIPNSIPNIVIDQTKLEIRERLGLDVTKKLILFGAFNLKHKRKGAEYLIEAFSSIPENSDYELMVFGKENELMNKINIKKHFLGYSSDEKYIRMIYKAADVYVNPSIEDNLPNTVLESMSVGTPVVAFNMGGMPDMIEHERNGYLAKFKNSVDLAKGIIWCLDNNKDSYLSKHAEQKVKTTFSPEPIGQKFYNLYRNLIQDNETES